MGWSVFSPCPSGGFWDTWPRHTDNRTHYISVLENALYFHSLGMNWKTDNWALKEKVLFRSSITMRMGAGHGWSSATIPVTPRTLILLCVFTEVCLPTFGQGQCGCLWYGGCKANIKAQLLDHRWQRVCFQPPMSLAAYTHPLLPEVNRRELSSKMVSFRRCGGKERNSKRLRTTDYRKKIGTQTRPSSTELAPNGIAILIQDSCRSHLQDMYSSH